MGLKKLLSKLGDMLDPEVELRKKNRKKLKVRSSRNLKPRKTS